MPKSPLQPYWSTKDGQTVRLYQGDVIEVLRRLPTESVHCCVTSPPYFGLRDYGTAEWEGGNAECDHQTRISRKRPELLSGDGKGIGCLSWGERDATIAGSGDCKKCGAKRVDRQLGSEAKHDCGQFGEPLVALREDLTHEEREYVLVELAKRDLL